jgi:hypothetical protein
MIIPLLHKIYLSFKVIKIAPIFQSTKPDNLIKQSIYQ